ncbi:MAG TPA: isocitrate lyase/phosphoenolpyruvate mutase family protein [Vicinamibacteria bacterium]|nr:isocitrate lyase/phosphoenolpyruvate mutase family protein [Vicinamibacteria bacterium]
MTQAQKAERFRALHRREGAFVIPNPWDVGSARLLAALGFEALATTSSGFANSLGRTDGEVTLDEKLEHCRALSAATEVPVSADLENCFADDPVTAAETITLAAQAGVVGGSIEDYTGDDSKPIYDLGLAVERVAAAVEAARRLPFPFTLTARAENLLHGRNDLDDTIERLMAFEAAGADVLYAPGLETLDQVSEVTRAVGKPVNVLAPPLRAATLAQLAEAGAKRVSIGGALCRAAFSPVIRAAVAMRDSGSFGWTANLVSSAEIERLFRKLGT